MKKEDKVKKKQLRSYKRKAKRIEKDRKYIALSIDRGHYSISIGRQISNGSYFECEMRDVSCEARGFCNGDC